MATGIGEVGTVILKEEAVLEKFDGEVEDGVLVERITLIDGELVKHEYFEDGEVVKTINYGEELTTEGGEDNRTN